jgi:protein-tyrosine-phosphatase
MRPDLQVDSAGLRVAIPISDHVREYLAKEDAEQYLKKAPENLTGKQLGGYDVIVAMQQGHKNAVLNRCPECEDKIVVWSVEDPYFVSHEDAEQVYRQIEEKVKQLAKSL